MQQIITLTSMCAVDEVARTLKRDSAGIDSTDESGNTPLHIAFSLGNSSLIKILIDAGADPTRVNLSGLRPRELAREEIKHETINHCLESEISFESSPTASFVSNPENAKENCDYLGCDIPQAPFTTSLGSNHTLSSSYLAEYRGAPVMVQPVCVTMEESSRSLLLTLRHPNLCLCMGFTPGINDRLSLICEACPGGSLEDALHVVNFSTEQKMKILSDISQALCYMHSKSPPVTHSRLSTKTIVLDTVVENVLDYVNVKIADICSLQLGGDPSDDIRRFAKIACEIFPDMPNNIHPFIQRCLSGDANSIPLTIDICRLFKTGN